MASPSVRQRAPRRERLVLQEISKALGNICVPMFEWQSRAITLRSRVVRRPDDSTVAMELVSFLDEVQQTREAVEGLSDTLSPAASLDSRYLDKVRSLAKLEIYLAETAKLLGGAERQVAE